MKISAAAYRYNRGLPPKSTKRKGVMTMKEIHSDADRRALLEKLRGQLSPEDESALQRILADKDAQQRLLSTPQARELMKQLFGK